MRLETLIPIVCSTLLLQTVLVVVSLQQDQQQQQQPLPQQPIQQLDSNPMPHHQDQRQQPLGEGGQRGLWPMVAVDKQENKSRVDVHVPIVFDMNSERDDGKSKLDLSVLHGLVTVSRDKAKQADGTLAGPMTVTVLGIPVYSGSGRRQSSIGDRITDTLQSRRQVTESSLPSSRTEGAVQQESEITSRVVDIAKKTNEKVFRSFNDLLDRLNTAVRNRIDSLTSQGSSSNNNPKKVSDNIINTGGNNDSNINKSNPVGKPIDVPVASVSSQQMPSSRSADLMKKSESSVSN